MNITPEPLVLPDSGTNEIYYKTFEASGKLFVDLTGRFPVRSS